MLWVAMSIVRRDPARVRRIFVELCVTEILPQQPELPQVIRDVLADVRAHRPIRLRTMIFASSSGPSTISGVISPWCARHAAEGSNLRRSFCTFRTFHHPAALVLTLRLQVQHALLFHQRKKPNSSRTSGAGSRSRAAESRTRSAQPTASSPDAASSVRPPSKRPFGDL